MPQNGSLLPPSWPSYVAPLSANAPTQTGGAARRATAWESAATGGRASATGGRALATVQGRQPLTRAISANEVWPDRIFSKPSSRRRRMPPRVATSAMASAEARLTTRLRISSSTVMTS
jgi:hypothetical protein